MNSVTFTQTLSLYRRRKPFHPFTIALQNGDRFEVDHADALVIRDRTAVYLAPGGIPVVFDHEALVQIAGDLKPQPDE